MNSSSPRRWRAFAFAGIAGLAGRASAVEPGALKTDSALERELAAAVSGFHGRAGIYVRNLSSGTEAALNADETFPTASLVKVPILVSLLSRVDRGELDYNGELVMTSTRAYDADDLAANLKDGTKISPAKLVWLMESLSDNSAALWCQELAGGGAAINAWLDGHGFARTRVNSRTEGREADKAKFGWGQTTPREMAGLMLLASSSSTAVTPAVSEEMLRVLSKSYWDGEALSQIPPAIHAASKQGAVDHSRSEVLLVEAPSGRYVLSVLTKDQTDTRYEHDNEGYELLRRVSRAVWEHDEGAGWKPRSESLRFYKKD
jgi:beta-lactamase class A